MRCAATAAIALSLSLLVACCASVSHPPPPDAETTLRRFDGQALRRRDIVARRNDALCVARALEAIERGLREPWVENRTAAALIDDLAGMAPDDFRIAASIWRLAEPLPRGAGRTPFGEHGFYADVSPTQMISAGVTPATLERKAEALLREHSDAGEAALMLAAWRRFAPRVALRRENYLASCFTFELGSASTALRDSLLGPFDRSRVLSTGREFLGGSNVMVDGYALAQGLAMLVSPGESSPVAATIDALVKTGHLPGFVKLDGALVQVSLSEADRAFLVAALSGLANGCGDVEYLPLGCTRVEVELDYLMGNSEARATLGFGRVETGWRFEKFLYEPAAASVVGRPGATLDLLEMLRHSQAPVALSGK